MLENGLAKSMLKLVTFEPVEKIEKSVQGAILSWKRRKGYRLKQGHRQEISVIKIDSIATGD